MLPDDLTRPLQKRPNNKRPHGMILPIIVGTVSGVLSGLAILFTVDVDRGKSLPPASTPQPAPADLVQQPAPISAPAPVTPPKTITVTVIDSQTGAKREVVFPAPTNDQPEGDFATPSTATIAPADFALGRGATKSKRH
jgi:hypothetical protein